MKTLKYIFVLSILVLFSISVYAETVGVLKFYKGDVKVKTSSSSKKWIKARLNMKLDKNYIIKTGKKSEASIKLRDGSLYKISSNKTIKASAIMLAVKAK